MARLRKNRWLPARNRPSSTRAGESSARRWGSSVRISRLVEACVRMWTSSPICRPWAATAKTSIGPPAVGRGLHRFVEQGPGDVAQESQALHGGRRLPPEPRHFARPLVDAGEGAGAPIPILDDPDPGRRADGRRHGNDGVVVVGRLERHFALLDQSAGLVGAVGPALGHHRRPDRAAQRVADVGPSDRRAAVEDRALADAGHHVGRRGQAGEQRHAGVEAAHHFSVGLVDRRRPGAVEAAEGGHRFGVAAGRDAPVDVGHLPPLGGDGIGEERQPQVDDTDVVGQRREPEEAGGRTSPVRW